MRTIYKYPFNVADEVTLSLPRGAFIWRFGWDQGRGYGNAVLWAEVDTDKPSEDRTLLIRGTGHPIPEGAVYLNTWEAGPMVWHAFTPRAILTMDDFGPEPGPGT